MRNNFAYYFIPAFYIIGILLLESFPGLSVILIVPWLLSILLSLIFIIIVLFKKVTLLKKTLFIFLLSIPVVDITFEISNYFLDKIKGEVVLSIYDKTFATTEYIKVRNKAGILKGEYDFSVAGFGEIEPADAIIKNDTTLILILKNRKHSIVLNYNRQNQEIKKANSTFAFRIGVNKILK